MTVNIKCNLYLNAMGPWGIKQQQQQQQLVTTELETPHVSLVFCGNPYVVFLVFQYIYCTYNNDTIIISFML